MSADFNKPAATSTKTGFLTEIKDMFLSLVKMDGSGANIPTGAIRYSSSNDRMEKWSGSAWVPVLESASPVGTVVSTVLASAPSGWILCQGQTVSKTGTYAALWAAMGSTHLFGADPGGGNFLLPDLRSRVPAGYYSGATGDYARFNSLGGSGGTPYHILALDETPSHAHGGVTQGGTAPHTHGYNDSSLASGSGAGAGADFQNTDSARTTGAASDTTHTHPISSSGGDLKHENMPPFLVLNYIVKL